MKLLTGLCMVLILVFLSSCASYKLGSPINPSQNKLQLGAIKNLSEEPRMVSYVSSKLRSSVLSDGNLNLVESNADMFLEVTVNPVQISSAASKKQDSTDENQRRYVTSVRRVSITLKYTLKEKSGKMIIENALVKASAEYTDFLDTNTSLNDGIQQAIHLATEEMLTSIVNNSW